MLVSVLTDVGPTVRERVAKESEKDDVCVAVVVEKKEPVVDMVSVYKGQGGRVFIGRFTVLSEHAVGYGFGRHESWMPCSQHWFAINADKEPKFLGSPVILL